VSFPDNYFTLEFKSEEVYRLFEKYGDILNVKITNPEEGKTYKQIKTAHALVTGLYLSGMANLPENCTVNKYKIIKKLDYGPCYEMEYKDQLVRIPKSMSDYSKDELSAFIDAMKIECIQSGALNTSEKIQQIFDGLGD
jgi:hypothetical protein